MAEQFRFDSSAFRIERMKDQNYLIRYSSLRPGSKMTIYMAESPDHFYAGGDFGKPIAQTTKPEVVIPNPNVDVRHYFHLQREQGDSITLAERQLSLQGAPNFRDLGGYETCDGRRLRWGKLFRSGKLSQLTEADIRYIKQLGVSHICDFRQVVEQELEPTWLGDDHPIIVAGLPITPGSTQNFMANLLNGVIDIDDAAGFMEEINRDFVINHMHQYAQMFQLLLKGEKQLLIHCAAGKDRTGFGAALILDVLGVPEETIIEDYLLTNSYLPVNEEIERLAKIFSDRTGSIVPEKTLRPMLEVRPQYINACFDEIKKRYESKQHFFQSALNLDPAEVALLRDRYLI